MDFVSIVRALWRNKRFAIPVLVLTAVAALYVVKMQPPVYQASASVLLKNPQGQATASQIAANPSLKTANPYNPFMSYGDLDVAANAVLELINSQPAQAALTEAGVDPRYTLSLSTANGAPPIIDISGVGGTARAAVRSANELVNTVKKDLYQIQQSQGINPFYMITAVSLVKPNQAYRASGKSKSLVAVTGIGVILLFVVVSTADAVAERRRVAQSSRKSNRIPVNRNGQEEDDSGVTGDMEFTGAPASARPGVRSPMSARRDIWRDIRGTARDNADRTNGARGYPPA